MIVCLVRKAMGGGGGEGKGEGIEQGYIATAMQPIKV